MDFSLTLQRMLTGKLYKPVAKESKLQKPKEVTYSKFCVKTTKCLFYFSTTWVGQIATRRMSCVSNSHSFISCLSQAASRGWKFACFLVNSAQSLEEMFLKWSAILPDWVCWGNLCAWKKQLCHATLSLWPHALACGGYLMSIKLCSQLKLTVDRFYKLMVIIVITSFSPFLSIYLLLLYFFSPLIHRQSSRKNVGAKGVLPLLLSFAFLLHCFSCLLAKAADMCHF